MYQLFWSFISSFTLFLSKHNPNSKWFFTMTHAEFSGLSKRRIKEISSYLSKNNTRQLIGQDRVYLGELEASIWDLSLKDILDKDSIQLTNVIHIGFGFIVYTYRRTTREIAL